MDHLIINVREWDDDPPVHIVTEGRRISAIAAGAARMIDAGGRPDLLCFGDPRPHLAEARIQPARDGILEEAIRFTGQLKAEQDRDDTPQPLARGPRHSRRQQTRPPLFTATRDRS